MRQLILDTETTGLDPKQGHKIIEFAALEMIDRKLTGNYLHLYINPEREIDIDASQIHGIYNKDVEDKPAFTQVIDKIIDFINGTELIIHNAKFDIGFLDYQFNSLGRGITTNYVSNVVDTLVMARRKFPGSKNSLDALCDRFKVDRSNRDYHGALIDCELLSEVYLQLTKEQISLVGMEKTQLLNSNNFKFDLIDAFKLDLQTVVPNETDLNEHKQILDNIDSKTSGNCLWNKANLSK